MAGMQVKLYKTKSPRNKINKSLSKNPKVFTGMKFLNDGDLDVTNPTIIVNMDDDVASNIGYNYMYIPRLSRYYWIEKITTEGAFMKITGKSDPLMSFRSDILRKSQIVGRISDKNKANLYLQDSELPLETTSDYYSIPFGEKVEDPNCINVILETAGKGGTPA